ncbi:MAG TPA: alpha/beta hydrolase, partial [Bacteroidales bacterium]|nr:alpha/beta hydrolase [Bacteroidales bacterium]
MKKLVIFVHGLGGDRIKSWGNFSELIRNNEVLNSLIDYDFYGFPTSLLRIPLLSKKFSSIQDLSLGLNTFIKNKHSSAGEIILVGHSLGGLVVRKYLIDTVINRTDINITKVLLYGVPNTGACLANISKFVSWKHR